MPNSVFVSSKPCSMAHRTPLSQTNTRRGVLTGALLMSYQYVGSAPRVRLSTSQTVWAGWSSLHRGTRLRANSYTMGPLVPSDTVRRYHARGPICCANFATLWRGVSGVVTTRCVRCLPLEVELCVVVATGASQQRVSSGTATKATVPTHASHAAQNSGLLP